MLEMVRTPTAQAVWGNIVILLTELIKQHSWPWAGGPKAPLAIPPRQSANSFAFCKIIANPQGSVMILQSAREFALCLGGNARRAFGPPAQALSAFRESVQPNKRASREPDSTRSELVCARKSKPKQVQTVLKPSQSA